MQDKTLQVLQKGAIKNNFLMNTIHYIYKEKKQIWVILLSTDVLHVVAST